MNDIPDPMGREAIREELHNAYHQCANYGGDTAELYRYRVLNMPPGQNSSLRGKEAQKILQEELQQFRATHSGVEIRVEGDFVDWHRIHITVCHTEDYDLVNDLQCYDHFALMRAMHHDPKVRKAVKKLLKRLKHDK